MKKHIPVEQANPHLSVVIQRNLETLSGLRRKNDDERRLRDKIADAITDFSGSLAFVYLHIAWFGAWIAVNSGRFGVRVFDPYPYGLLTMVVSLEAIFLSTFVLISQNRLSVESERRADLALQIGLLTEYELTRVLKMLDAIQDKIGIENDTDAELRELEQDVRPEDVLSAITRMQSLRRSKEITPGNSSA